MLFPSVGVNREDTDILGIICYASCKTEVIYVSSFKKIVVPNQFLLIKCPPPPTRRVGRYIVFGADPVSIGVRCFVSVHYLLDKLMDCDHTCIDTLFGEGKEVIRFG